MNESLKIVFMGTSDLAGIILDGLIKSPHEMLAVVTQPETRNKSRKNIVENPVKIIAKEKGIKLFQPEKLDENFIKELEELNPDLIVVAAFGKILSERILEIPKFKSINVHASLLPELRGPSPIQNSLLRGDKETGITIMLMDKGVDTGDILSQKKINISDNDNYITLTGKLAIAGSKLLLETIPKWANKEIKPQKQDDETATLCQLIERSDGRIFWDKSAKFINNSFRAFRVWPGIFTFWENDGSLKKIGLTSIHPDENKEGENFHFGEVFQREDKKICVQTSKGVIVIEKLQLEGKKESEALSFINGYPNFVGSILK